MVVKGAACFSVTPTMLGVVGTGVGPQPEPGPPEGFPGTCQDWNSAGVAVLQQPHVHMEEAGRRGEGTIPGVGAGTGPMAGDPLFLMFPTPLCMRYLDLSKNYPFFVYFLKNVYFLAKKNCGKIYRF